MSVFRVEKNKNYTVMANYHLRDKRLSFRARGLLSTILSLPDDWDYSVKGLVTLAKDGFDSVKTTLKELEETGYLVRKRDRNYHGQLSKMIYTIYEEPQLTEGSPTEGIPTQVEPTEAEPHQLSKDITNIYKEPNTEGTNNACLLTSHAREEAVENYVSFIIDKTGRPISTVEHRILVHWVETGINPDLVHLAVEDNLFRDERFNLRYVQKTLDEWQSHGITNVRDAKNFVLDRHVDNLSQMAASIADKNYNDELRESIVFKNEAADLQGTRDYIIDLFRQRRYDSMMGLLKITYHKDILDYLPEEIVVYYEKHKDD